MKKPTQRGGDDRDDDCDAEDDLPWEYGRRPRAEKEAADQPRARGIPALQAVQARLSKFLGGGEDERRVFDPKDYPPLYGETENKRALFDVGIDRPMFDAYTKISMTVGSSEYEPFRNPTNMIALRKAGITPEEAAGYASTLGRIAERNRDAYTDRDRGLYGPALKMEKIIEDMAKLKAAGVPPSYCKVFCDREFRYARTPTEDTVEQCIALRKGGITEGHLQSYPPAYSPEVIQELLKRGIQGHEAWVLETTQPGSEKRPWRGDGHGNGYQFIRIQDAGLTFEQADEYPCTFFEFEIVELWKEANMDGKAASAYPKEAWHPSGENMSDHVTYENKKAIVKLFRAGIDGERYKTYPQRFWRDAPGIFAMTQAKPAVTPEEAAQANPAFTGEIIVDLKTLGADKSTADILVRNNKPEHLPYIFALGLQGRSQAEIARYGIDELFSYRVPYQDARTYPARFTGHDIRMLHNHYRVPGPLARMYDENSVPPGCFSGEEIGQLHEKGILPARLVHYPYTPCQDILREETRR